MGTAWPGTRRCTELCVRHLSCRGVTARVCDLSSVLRAGIEMVPSTQSCLAHRTDRDGIHRPLCLVGIRHRLSNRCVYRPCGRSIHRTWAKRVLCGKPLHGARHIEPRGVPDRSRYLDIGWFARLVRLSHNLRLDHVGIPAAWR